ncbi:MAG: metal-sensing transcriptional repressor, partial [Clostridia bacterium]|nr:metal-sensing transcriptional repressor [Clostridia bacterium]
CCTRYKHTPRDPEMIHNLENRLNRMVGQLNGIKRMIDENRYCGDILTQISAVESALRNVGYIIMEEHVNTCVREKVLQGDNEVLGETLELMKKLK